LKVLLIAPLPPPEGGMQSWTREYMDWVADKDNMEVCLINTGVTGRRATNPNARRNGFDELNRSRGILDNLHLALSSYNPDVVHLNSSCGEYGIIRDYLCAVVIKNKRLPLVVQYHCNIEDQIKKSRWGLYFIKRITSLADTALVLNSTSQEFLHRATGHESLRTENFMDEAYFMHSSKTISASIRKILFVGHVYEKKGVREIFAAAELLPQINFALAGPVAPHLSTAHIPDNVLLLAEVDNKEVIGLLDSADVFLFPSYSEGFSLALLEAMARGVPVIATPVGANADMVEQYGGIMVRVGSVEDIVGAINDLSPAPIREKMSQWNIKKAASTYSIDSVMNRLIGMYEETVRCQAHSLPRGRDWRLKHDERPSSPISDMKRSGPDR